MTTSPMKDSKSSVKFGESESSPAVSSSGARVDGRFPREAQLRRTADYRRVYEGGTRRQFGWTAAFLLRTGNQGGRVGITVPRHFGKAVSRNRMKRRLRAAIGACMQELPGGWDIVLHPRAAGLELESGEMLATLKKIFAHCARQPASGAR